MRKPAKHGPWPLEASILVTDSATEAKHFADSKRLEDVDGIAIVDRVASTVIILDREFSAAERDRLSTDPTPLIARYFQLL